MWRQGQACGLRKVRMEDIARAAVIFVSLNVTAFL
jgi:hypothetical protein